MLTDFDIFSKSQEELSCKKKGFFEENNDAIITLILEFVDYKSVNTISTTLFLFSVGVFTR